MVFIRTIRKVAGVLLVVKGSGIRCSQIDGKHRTKFDGYLAPFGCPKIDDAVAWASLIEPGMVLISSSSFGCRL